MHIPDGFLRTEVWAPLDVVAIPAVSLLARSAQRKFDHHRVPLMGVMGAFIFAAQMINFPVGNGTSGHLVGAALLAFTLGPAAASIVMTAILATQALVFQDGGVLALGANVFNMAIAGVWIGYAPFALLRGRKVGVFLGGMLSLLVSALLALTELLLSDVPMPPAILAVSISLFVVSAVMEGAITLIVVQALERIQPGFLRRPAGGGAGGGWSFRGIEESGWNSKPCAADRHRFAGDHAFYHPFRRLPGGIYRLPAADKIGGGTGRNYRGVCGLPGDLARDDSGFATGRRVICTATARGTTSSTGAAASARSISSTR
jgi:cobalt/nickel transport system permease protein